MDYLIEKTSLMVKGKNFPEGGIISDSVLTKQDIKDLAKYLKPINGNDSKKDDSARNQKGKSSSKPA
ncbi:MAG: hypothetical protein P8Z35_15155 [Ignavibacteriaceae bacterium]|jgi:hypothetical protein